MKRKRIFKDLQNIFPSLVLQMQFVRMCLFFQDKVIQLDNYKFGRWLKNCCNLIILVIGRLLKTKYLRGAFESLKQEPSLLIIQLSECITRPSYFFSQNIVFTALPNLSCKKHFFSQNNYSEVLWIVFKLFLFTLAWGFVKALMLFEFG